jgi:hypothetical protein
MEEQIETKKCTKCKAEKPLSYFSKSKKGDKRRFVRVCKTCQAALRSPEAINARMRTKSGRENWMRNVMFGLNGRDY